MMFHQKIANVRYSTLLVRYIGIKKQRCTIFFKKLIGQCHRRIVTSKVKQVTSNAHPCLSGGNDPETCARKQKDTRINKTDVGFWFRDVKKVKTVSTIFRLDWATLTANIGGTMGLFLGWGLLDFIMKVYEYLIKLICFISKRFLNTPLDISP